MLLHSFFGRPIKVLEHIFLNKNVAILQMLKRILRRRDRDSTLVVKVFLMMVGTIFYQAYKVYLRDEIRPLFLLFHFEMIKSAKLSMTNKSLTFL